MRIFTYDACNEARLVSGLFGRANHWPAVSFCGSAKHLQAARRLLELPGSLLSRPRRELWQTGDRRAGPEANSQRTPAFDVRADPVFPGDQQRCELRSRDAWLGPRRTNRGLTKQPVLQVQGLGVSIA